MSKKIFINNLNTFVAKQLLEELRNDKPGEDGEANPDPNVILGTYIEKDSSEKPEGVKKMLKVSLQFQLLNLNPTEIQAQARHEIPERVRLDHLRPAFR